MPIPFDNYSITHTLPKVNSQNAQIGIKISVKLCAFFLLTFGGDLCYNISGSGDPLGDTERGRFLHRPDNYYLFCFIIVAFRDSDHTLSHKVPFIAGQ